MRLDRRMNYTPKFPDQEAERLRAELLGDWSGIYHVQLHHGHWTQLERHRWLKWISPRIRKFETARRAEPRPGIRLLSAPRARYRPKLCAAVWADHLTRRGRGATFGAGFSGHIISL